MDDKIFKAIYNFKENANPTALYHDYNTLLLCKWLEVIIDYGSTSVTYGNEIESKGVQFPGQDAPDKISGGG